MDALIILGLVLAVLNPVIGGVLVGYIVWLDDPVIGSQLIFLSFMMLSLYGIAFIIWLVRRLKRTELRLAALEEKK